jgi:benzoyl-CoA-dihydrodiol lyase
VQDRALELAAASDRPDDDKGIELTPLVRAVQGDQVDYDFVKISIERDKRIAIIELRTAEEDSLSGLTLDEVTTQGADFWPLAVCRQLDDAILHLRSNETKIGTLIFKTQGASDLVEAYDVFIQKNLANWFMREVSLYWRRTLKRIDLSSRTLFAFVEQGSCFAGMFAELLFCVDRSYMLEDQLDDNAQPAPTIRLSTANFGPFTMSNGITRLQTRFLGEPDSLKACEAVIGESLDAVACEKLGLITYRIDALDWDDELRILTEERASYSPDALTGMEANLRFAGPETMESKIFGRLSAWQNWIFQRPNAVGDDGALKLYGTGSRAIYDLNRV